MNELLKADLAIHVLIEGAPNLVDKSLERLHLIVVEHELLVHVHLQQQGPDLRVLQEATFVRVIDFEAHDQVCFVLLQLHLQVHVLQLFVVVDVPEVRRLVSQDQFVE